MNTSTSNRYNLFNYIHKGMRAMLYHSGMALQHADFKNRVETGSVFEKIAEVLRVSNDHALQENRFILPVIAKYDRELVKTFEGEHLADDLMSHRLKNLMALYYHAVSDDEKLEKGDEVFKAFNEFIAFNMYHMNKEEDSLNRMLWLNYSDKELFGMQQAITASIPPELMVVEASWIMRGISNAEIVQLLSSIKNNAHDTIFQNLLQIAEDQLPEERWNKIKEALCEGEMINCD